MVLRPYLKGNKQKDHSKFRSYLLNWGWLKENTPILNFLTFNIK